MRPIQLSPRLLSVAEQVQKGARFADVGTDHAYLPVWLLQRGVIRRAIASDLREGPLARAKSTAERYGLTEQMEFRLCSGLEGISPDEVDTVAIAGMGGETIAAILAAAPWVKTAGTLLLLQPMSAQADLRQWLQENGYTIEREYLCAEGRTLYNSFRVRAGETPPLTPAERWAGCQHREHFDPLRGAYLEDLRRRAARAVEGVRRSVRPEDALRLPELELTLDGLNKMLEEWKQWQV